jgi:hypothetical protein
MKHRLAIPIVIGVLGGLSATPCSAQTLLAPPSAPSQATQSPQVELQPLLPSTGVPGTVSPGTTSTLTPPTGPTPRSRPGKSFGTVGRGLPGMSGGPPLNAPMGAMDTSGSTMRPLVIGPLFCDPAIDIVC